MKRERLERRAAKIVMVNGLSTAMSIAFQVISVPVCLKYWGKETYGLWLVLFSTFLLLRSVDAGYVTYVGNKLNCLYHDESRALRNHLSSALAGIAVTGGLQLLLAIAFVISKPLADLLGMPSSEPDGVLDRLGLLVMIASWILTGSYLGIIHRLLIPVGMMYQAAWWAMAFQISQFAVLVAGAMLQLNMLQVSILFASSQAGNYIASVVYVRYKLPAYYPWWQGASVSIGLRDLRQSMMLTTSNIVQQAGTNGIALLVSALAGPGLLPAFTTVRTLSNLWTSVTNLLTAPLLPDVVRFHVNGEAGKLAAANEAYWVLVGAIVNFSVLLAYPLLPGLYGYWTGNAVELDRGLLRLLLASVVVTNVGALMAMHLNGVNSLRIVLLVSVARCVLSLGIGAISYQWLGLPGFGWGILVGELVALAMTGRHFVIHELTPKMVKVPITTFWPTALGTTSVLLYLAGVGAEWLPTLWAWMFAFAGVVAATVWGVRRLDQTVRSRLFGMAAHQ